MAISLKKFKDEFIDHLIEVHWKHWTTLGAAGNIEPEKSWIIDLEALTISTFVIGLYDKRLLNAAIEWIVKNGYWINLSRLKRIGKNFMVNIPNSNVVLLPDEVFKLIIATIKKIDRGKFPDRKKDIRKSQTTKVNPYKKIIDAFRMRNIVTEPKLKPYPSLLQLLLRGIYGIDARVEVFIYLLTHESGNSNSIAKESFHNQRNIYKVLDSLSKAGVVVRCSGRKIKDYSLRNKEGWFRMLGLKEDIKYLNWSSGFLTLNFLAKVLFTTGYANDRYLVSSVFRDLINDFWPIGKALNIDIPDSRSYPGGEYFDPFATTCLTILERLIK